MDSTDLVTAVAAWDVQWYDAWRLTKQFNPCLGYVVTETDGQIHKIAASVTVGPQVSQ